MFGSIRYVRYKPLLKSSKSRIAVSASPYGCTVPRTWTIFFHCFVIICFFFGSITVPPPVRQYEYYSTRRVQFRNENPAVRSGFLPPTELSFCTSTYLSVVGKVIFIRYRISLHHHLLILPYPKGYKPQRKTKTEANHEVLSSCSHCCNMHRFCFRGVFHHRKLQR